VRLVTCVNRGVHQISPIKYWTCTSAAQQRSLAARGWMTVLRTKPGPQGPDEESDVADRAPLAEVTAVCPGDNYLHH
jgi:hypothetical protein